MGWVLYFLLLFFGSFFLSRPHIFKEDSDMPMIISGQPAQDPRLTMSFQLSTTHAPSRDSVQKQTVSSPSPVR